MKRAIIIANGRMEKPPQVASTLQGSDLIIAADGGIHNCLALGIQPHVVIGDLDSVGQEEAAALQSSGIQIMRFPARKDETDMELALQYSLQEKSKEVIVLGALGARWDMTIANVLLAAHPQFSGLRIRFLDGTQELVLLRPGENLDLKDRVGDSVSLIPLRGDAVGVTTHGLDYPLDAETLWFGSPRGVSNTIIRERTDISFTEGLLLCVLSKSV